jgi:hypothetical protein
MEMERIWKEFGKNSEAGKLLYELYGVRYQPKINYPSQIKKKSQTEIKKEGAIDQKRRHSIDIRKRMQAYDYPKVEIQRKTYNFAKIDFVPKRKSQQEIQKELNIIKNSIVPPKQTKFKSRKEEIEKMQEKFQFDERTILPKKARLPGIKDDPEKIILEQYEKEKLELKDFKNDETGELHFLYNQILREIDDRYIELEDLETKKTKVKSAVSETVILNEIRERVDELKKIQKIIDDKKK